MAEGGAGAGSGTEGSGVLVGNVEVRRRLARLADADRLHPCLLFEGPPGVGKAATALWLARYINCESPLGRPCGQCWPCRHIAKGTHPDVLQVGLDPERTAPIISVRQARELTSGLTLRPYAAKRRVVILDPADAMSSGAANALLKTFEEPPDATGFVLVTSAASGLLPTVRSRSQRIRFGPLAPGELEDFLEARGVDERALPLRLAAGCPGEALALSQGRGAAWTEARAALLAALAAPVEARLAYTEALVKGDRAATQARAELVLDVLSRLAVDALGAASGRAPRYHADLPEVVAEWGQRLGTAGSGRVVTAVERAEAQLRAFVNTRLVFDALLAAVVGELGRRPGSQTGRAGRGPAR